MAWFFLERMIKTLPAIRFRACFGWRWFFDLYLWRLWAFCRVLSYEIRNNCNAAIFNGNWTILCPWSALHHTILLEANHHSRPQSQPYKSNVVRPTIYSNTKLILTHRFSPATICLAFAVVYSWSWRRAYCRFVRKIWSDGQRKIGRSLRCMGSC